ncbi:cellulose synthase subunit BcsC-related outer membrane protein [Caulobacter segnis]|uniref:cellulose synthase subunit BcsC-related outer membrane protein n=1 Tax=Caulobacter segnis TaxID=88688 RepID=UPI00240F224F|nr:cellulose synthase subunit BcsC-related outer membrane protein [Caulobacter segnis]MDG2521015.1 cellulose synthase subunit BcsC-related outer membrane protein [Caulobacter segnis]
MTHRPSKLGPAGTLTAGVVAAATAAALIMPSAVEAQSTTQAVDALLKQATFWRERGRKDLAEQALNRALSANPRSADTLAALARYAAEDGNQDAAKRWTDRLRSVAPNDPRLATLGQVRAGSGTVAVATAARGGATPEVAEARRLARAGDTTGAVRAYRKAFPNGNPQAAYRLEYYQTLSGVTESAAEGRRGLEAMLKERPNDKAVALALGQALTYQESTRREGIAQLSRLSREGGAVAGQARASWRQALLWMGNRPADLPLYEEFLRTGADAQVSAKIAQINDSTARETAARETAARNAAQQRAATPAAPVDRGAPYRTQGFAALERGDLQTAEQNFQSALRIRAGDSDALGGVGLVRLRRENFVEAKTYLQRAIKAAPANRARWSEALETATFFGDLRAAQAAAARGDTAQAERLARPLASSASKDRALAQQLLADIFLRGGRNAEAEQLYRQVLAANRTNTDAQAGLIEALLRLNRFAEAEQLARATVDRTPGPLNNTRGRIEHAKAQQFMAAGDYSSAYASFEAALAADPTDPWIRYDFARFLVSQGQGPAAEGLMAMLAQSTTVEGLNAAALFAQQQGRSAEAYALLSRIHPQARTPALNELAGQLYLDTAIQQAKDLRTSGRNAEAMALLHELLARPNMTVGVQGSIADALYDLGDKPQAINLAQRILTSGAVGADPAAYGGFVSVLARSGRDAEAAALIRQIGATPAANTPSGRQGMSGLVATLGSERADRLRLAGDYAQAFDVLSNAFASAPNDTRLLSGLARLYQSGGLTAQAGQVYDVLLRMNPNDPEAMNGVLEAAVARGDVSRAKELLRAAMQRTPGDPNLYLIAARLEQQAGDKSAAIKALETARVLRERQGVPIGPSLYTGVAPVPVSPFQAPSGALGSNPFRSGGSPAVFTPYQPVPAQPVQVLPQPSTATQPYIPGYMLPASFDQPAVQTAFNEAPVATQVAWRTPSAPEEPFAVNASFMETPAVAEPYLLAQAQTPAALNPTGRSPVYPPSQAYPSQVAPTYADPNYPSPAPQPGYQAQTYLPPVQQPATRAPLYPTQPQQAAPRADAPMSTAPYYASPTYQAPQYQAPTYQQAPVYQQAPAYQPQQAPTYPSATYAAPTYAAPASPSSAPYYGNQTPLIQPAPTYPAPVYPTQTYTAPTYQAPTVYAPPAYQPYQAPTYSAPQQQPTYQAPPRTTTPAARTPAAKPRTTTTAKPRTPTVRRAAPAARTYPAPVAPQQQQTYTAPTYPTYQAPALSAPFYPSTPSLLAPAPPAPNFTAPVYTSPYVYPSTNLPSYPVQPQAYQNTPPVGGYGALPTPVNPLLPRAPARDGVLQSIDRQIAELSETIGPRVDASIDFRARSGEAGLSQLDELSAKVTGSISPFGRGRLSATLNPVSLDAGTPTDESLQRFGTNPLSVARDTISDITPPVIRRPNPHTAAGVAAEIAYEVDGLKADIGVTPVGFAKPPEMTGGLSVEPNIGGLRPRVWIERRPVTDSVTSYASSRDPLTGRRWGQVMRNTAGVGVAYERGKMGFYADASASKYDGRLVEENESLQFNVGAYIRPYVSTRQVVQLGTNLNLQSYDNNQNVFSYGNGGYFSPQQFTAIAFPMSWKVQGDRWGGELRATPGYQTYSQSARDYFPTDPTLQGAQNAISAQDPDVKRGFSGSSRSGFGINGRAAIDYKFTPTTTFGGALSFDNFGEYSETKVGLYIRQTIGGSR